MPRAKTEEAEIERRRKIGEASKNRPSGMLGKHHSKESKEKSRQANLGQKRSVDFCKKRSEINKGNKYHLGYKNTEEAKEKMRQKALGRIPWNKGLTKETDKRIAELGKKISKNQRDISGKNNPFYNHKHSEESKQKMREDRVDVSGKNSYLWKGGISFEPYSLEWNERLRQLIRKRDNFECQLCGISENGNAHDVHHINYNKKDCKERNLITLCHSDNAKANIKRDKWQFLFETLQEIRQI